jgi:hypothetical protein
LLEHLQPGISQGELLVGQGGQLCW